MPVDCSVRFACIISQQEVTVLPFAVPEWLLQLPAVPAQEYSGKMHCSTAWSVLKAEWNYSQKWVVEEIQIFWEIPSGCPMCLQIGHLVIWWALGFCGSLMNLERNNKVRPFHSGPQCFWSQALHSAINTIFQCQQSSDIMQRHDRSHFSHIRREGWNMWVCAQEPVCNETAIMGPLCACSLISSS